MSKKRPVARETTVTMTGDGLEFSAPGKKPHTFLVTSEGGGGPPIWWEFDTLKEALEFAKESWGVGAQDIYGPDGKQYRLENEEMPFKLNLVRLRKGKLNPRQQLLMDEWLANGLGKVNNEVASNPRGLISHVAGVVGSLSKAIDLVERAWAYGLLEIIDWVDGREFPDRRVVDHYIETGGSVAI